VEEENWEPADGVDLENIIPGEQGEGERGHKGLGSPYFCNTLKF